jgi:phosphate-selective porin OprO/OprP
MKLMTGARARRLRRGALIAVLMCGAAGAAMAAPATKGPDPRDAKIEALQQQLQMMNAEIEQLRSSGGASSERLDAMQAQLNSFAQAIADMKAQTETATADIATLKVVAPTSVTTTLNNARPTWQTADKRFSAQLRGVMMFDTTQYLQDSPNTNLSVDLRRGAGSGDTARARDLNSGTNFRRARFGIEGKAFQYFDYGFIMEFGGSGSEDAGHIHDLWLQYSPPQAASINGKIRVGAFEPIIGMSASVSTSSMAFIERPSPAEVARNYAAGDSRSAVQLFGNGDIGAGGDQGISAYWLASTALTGSTVGTLNSVGSFGTQPFDEQKAWIGRFAVAPHDGTNWLAHFGVNFQYVFRPADVLGPDTAGTRYPFRLRDRPETRTDGTRFVDTGDINTKDAWVLGLESGFQMQQFYVEGEYFRYAIDRYNSTLANPRFKGWYVQGSWVLTGEPRRYNQVSGAFDGPAVNFPFNPNAGTWGAWEVAARYSDLDLNFHQLTPSATAADLVTASSIRGGEQKIATVELNWYLNSVVMFKLGVSHVQINRLAPSANFGGGTYPIGSQIGQDFNVITLRSQLSF